MNTNNNDIQSQSQQSSSQHEVILQQHISHEEIRDSLNSNHPSDQIYQNNHSHLIQSLNEEDQPNINFYNRNYDEELINRSAYDPEIEVDDVHVDIDDVDLEMSHGTDHSKPDDSQPSLEQIQKVYYLKGLQEFENLQLFDLSTLANWKLSSYKSGFGLSQLRDDSPETYWQSDGSNGSSNSNSGNNMLLNNNNQLINPHTITIQFSKKVSLERVSIFTNYSLDESYTPSKIKIMAGTSEGLDLIEVCTVNFNQPIGWSHIIFNGIRNDGVLKCFILKILILANHQEGKDSHIRAIRCYGKKSQISKSLNTNKKVETDFLKDLSLVSGGSNLSGFSMNNRIVSGITEHEDRIEEEEKEDDDEENIEDEKDVETSKVLGNVSSIIGFNTGFQSIELKSRSSIR
ncbi:unnamed protein product [Candida verbasci]|uniref:DOC domain-containing protein n=1 Tax=Candida verbasci TaxID=1227364 RepID=A0A9W4XJZ3_9ASCO|nr:unnamed protein product [Candida verbasci]